MCTASGSAVAAFDGVGNGSANGGNSVGWDGVGHLWCTASGTPCVVVAFEPASRGQSGEDLIGLPAGEPGDVHDAVPVMRFGEVGQE